jgi:ferrous iron transport protein B
MQGATVSPRDHRHHPQRRGPRWPLRAALLGNPNCGKTALFNLLTGARQKVANYAGVTVERKEGWLSTPAAARVRDLPGTYSLHAHSEDERITRDIVKGSMRARRRPSCWSA